MVLGKVLGKVVGAVVKVAVESGAKERWRKENGDEYVFEGDTPTVFEIQEYNEEMSKSPTCRHVGENGRCTKKALVRCKCVVERSWTKVKYCNKPLCEDHWYPDQEPSDESSTNTRVSGEHYVACKEHSYRPAVFACCGQSEPDQIYPVMKKERERAAAKGRVPSYRNYEGMGITWARRREELRRAAESVRIVVVDAPVLSPAPEAPMKKISRTNSIETLN